MKRIGVLLAGALLLGACAGSGGKVQEQQCREDGCILVVEYSDGRVDTVTHTVDESDDCQPGEAYPSCLDTDQFIPAKHKTTKPTTKARTARPSK